MKFKRRACLACGALVDPAHLDDRGYCRTCRGLDERTGRPVDTRITAEDRAFAEAALAAPRSKQ